MLQKTRALILHRYEFSESSLVIKALTPQGPVSLLAKGARRPKSPLRGQLEPLYETEVVYNNKESRDLHPLNQVSLLEPFRLLHERLEHNATGGFLSEIILRAYPGGMDHPEEIYNLFHQYLRLLNHPDLKAPRLHYVVMRFLAGFCDALGFGINSSHCSECGFPFSFSNEPEHNRANTVSSNHTDTASSGSIRSENPWCKVHDLNLSEGALWCSDCRAEANKRWSPVLLEHLPLISSTQSPEITAKSRVHLEDFMLHYLQLHIGQSLNLKSLEWYRSMV